MTHTRTRTIALLAGLALVAVSQGTLAAGNSGKRYIKQLVHPNAARLHVVAKGSEWDNPDACDRSDQIILTQDDVADERVYREMLAMILSAHVSDRRIAARVNGCTTINGQTYPAIVQVTLL
jgi:hypothetical protein